ncbi:hypothetical protein HL033_03200 [Neoehrlichia mikurensis]|uniref:Lipoprotein n=1 Tax=Neoehrlichia mikurensis TaxID=89586 RepID=A0A9Q9C152_9RICK|nr:hypothetical protein [Neoehrlichia mikurensis]QXK91752.1 hypothetical protein IAH97_03195 [Neoehrlichia mikurensis]QXK92964.1 hypothetical protein HUN61_03190 [Neoehrlichia mikurensis]QXK93442.1 hypothetical protein HL033_03200 [Neoehrlichia mikurensis]UTO55604.1 hypothetical protein LUA82_00745 [Neoehrlichia mikurensis]UTO56525.1 hypothetical protein LUA81_00745 [Neoehrlichia mikurensis]
MKYFTIALYCIIFFAVSCSPVYRTVFHYTQPSTQEGKKCIRQCVFTYNNCLRQCQAQSNECRLKEKLYNIPSSVISSIANIATITNTKNDDSANNNTLLISTNKKSICNIDECQRLCRSDYNMCFIDCGGQVTSSSVCVHYCDKK